MKKPGCLFNLSLLRSTFCCFTIALLLLCGPGTTLTAQIPEPDTTEIAAGDAAPDEEFEGYMDPVNYEGPTNEAAPSDDQWAKATREGAYGYRDEVESAQAESGPRKFKPRASAPEIPTGLLKVLLVVVVLIVAGAIIYNMVGQRGLFSKKSKKQPRSSEENDFESLPDLAGSELERRMAEAAERGDLRAAIRYGFLRSLQLLDEHGHIEHQPEKTNFTYEREIGHAGLKQSFRGMRLVYERAWYGDSTPTRETFDAFLGFYSNIKSGTGA